MISNSFARLSPARAILIFTFLTIVTGTLLLSLPIARTTDLALIDVFFTATSSTCATGIFTVPLDSFTYFGHCIILFLIQIGGVGLITLTFFLLYLFFDLRFGTQILVSQILEIESWKEVRKFLIYIMGITFIVEFVGAIFIFFSIKQYYPLNDAVFFSIFHSISSFCNAGITLFSPHHLRHIHSDYGLQLITALLMFIGGAGFITWIEVVKATKSLLLKKRFRFSLLIKIIFMGSFFLIVIPALLMLALEYNHAFADLSWPDKIINAFFNSFALRSTGFFSVSISALHTSTLLLFMTVSFIGAAPGSTGSGIKITTLVILATTIKSALSNMTMINIKGRRIPKDQVLRAITIFILSTSLVISTIFILSITQPHDNFLDIVSEAVSAFANIELTTGLLTFLLTLPSKILIIFTMIIGRIGSLTLVLALRKRNNQPQNVTSESISYPEERVMLS